MEHVANTNYIQATVEIFGALICLITMLIIANITQLKEKSIRIFLWTFAISIISLLGDAGWYLFDGDASTTGIMVNHVSNLIVFLSSSLEAIGAASYAYQLIKERGGQPKRILVSIAYILAVVSIIFTIVNEFVPWLYDFDEWNVYYRMSGWGIYVGCNLLSMALSLLMIILGRKKLGKEYYPPMVVFVLSPSIGLVLQSIMLGASLLNLGVAISLLYIMFNYLKQWMRNKESVDVKKNREKTFWIFIGLFGVMILCTSASAVSNVISIHQIASESSEENSRVVAHMVRGAMDNELLQPITAARTMVNAKEIRDALEEPNLVGTQKEQDMIAYLGYMREEFGYQTSFLISSKTMAYYSYNGFNKTMDPEHDAHDAWYTEFVKCGRTYDLDVDTDEVNVGKLTVFFNTAVHDQDGNLLGVCGVGFSVEKMMELFSEYESKHGLEISLIDENGLVMVDSDPLVIEQACLEHDYLSQVEDGEFYYQKQKETARLTCYIGDLGWYLVIRDRNPMKIDVTSVLMPSIVIYVLGVILMLALIYMFMLHEKSRNDEMDDQIRLTETDRLTGFLNRTAYEKVLEALETGEQDYSCVVMLDVNGLKTVNDTVGHDAGDELIVGASRCISETFEENGNVYRIGGDEFVIISNTPKENFMVLLEHFKEIADSWQGELIGELSVSLGIAAKEDYPQMGIREVIRQADQLMYIDKNEYYRKTGKNRRMSW